MFDVVQAFLECGSRNYSQHLVWDRDAMSDLDLESKKFMGIGPDPKLSMPVM